MSTKKEAGLLAQPEPRPMETTNSIGIEAETVNALRELRLGREISAADMVATVQALYPRYDKHLQSKAERSHLYGIRLCDDAMAALVKAYAPDKEPDPKPKAPEIRTNPCRLVVRVSVEDYNLLMDQQRAEGFSTTQDWLYSHLKKYLKAKGAYQ
ncbi:MAG: hypothetical protein GX171_02640 [Clostridiales bacterium]|jgi:hypothetical protein|nr:hypothetical protein [Clostridiales bacterium]